MSAARVEYKGKGGRICFPTYVEALRGTDRRPIQIRVYSRRRWHDLPKDMVVTTYTGTLSASYRVLDYEPQMDKAIPKEVWRDSPFLTIGQRDVTFRAENGAVMWREPAPRRMRKEAIR